MNNPVSQSHCIDSKLFTLFKVMRSLFLLGFFVFFATLQSSLSFHLRDCGYGFDKTFVLKEGNVVGRGFKNWDNYTHAKSVIGYDICIYKDKSINITLRCRLACIYEERCQSYEFSPREKRCNLNKEWEPTDPRGNFGDYLFCKRRRALGSPLPAWICCHNCPCNLLVSKYICDSSIVTCVKSTPTILICSPSRLAYLK